MPVNRPVRDTPFGMRVREARKSKGWTQLQLAEATGVCTYTIRSYEKLGMYPKLELLDALCRALGVSPCWLLGTPCNVDQRVAEIRGRLHREIDRIA